MGNFNKWNRGENLNTDQLNVVLFVSRNKDNKELENFSERRNAFVTTKEPRELRKEFDAFAAKGLPGETSRMYVSVNPRSNSKTFKELQHKMLDGEFNLASLPQRTAGLAARKENAYDSKHPKWLFDFDPVGGENTQALLEQFLTDLELAHQNTQTKKGQERPQMTVEVYDTPNGYAVVTDQRFDTRALLEKYPNVECKRDDLLCYAWKTKRL